MGSNIYTKEAFIEDVAALEVVDSRSLLFWYKQYELYASGERGDLIHETTTVLMEPWDCFQGCDQNTMDVLDRKE